MASNNSTTSLDFSNETRQPKLFAIMLTLLIPSLICSIYLFIQFCIKHTLRHQIHNQLLLILLMANFLQATTEIPLMLFFLHNGIFFQSDALCQMWTFVDFTLNVVILWLMLYGSIERYLLVFHHHFFITHIILLHYIPIGFCFIYPTIFYVVVLFFYPCTNTFQYNLYICGGPCFLFDSGVSTFNLLWNIIFPVIGTVLSSTILLWRVIQQKQRMRQRNIWKKNRRMTWQILSVCSLHTVIWISVVTLLLIVLYSPISNPVLRNLSINLPPFGYLFVVLLYPFIMLVGLDELWLNAFKSWQRRLRPTVNPGGMAIQN